MTTVQPTGEQPQTAARSWLVASRPRLLLALVWLVHAILNLAWLWQDNRYPAGDTATHLVAAIRTAGVLSHPSPDLVGQLAVAANGQPSLYYVLTAPLIWLFGPGADAATVINLAFLALLLACTYATVRLLVPAPGRPQAQESPADWMALAAATLLSLFPLVFTYTRIYNPAIAVAALVSLACWLLLRSDSLQQRPYVVAFGLVAIAGTLTGPSFWAFVAGPVVLVAALALRTPRLKLPPRRKPSRNLGEWINRRLRLAPAHWNLLLGTLLSLLSLPAVLAYAGTTRDAATAGPAWMIGYLDDAMGGFFLLLLIVGVSYGLWQAIRPARLGARRAFGFLLAWLVLGLLLSGLAGWAAPVSQIMPGLPAAATLCVLWWPALAGSRTAGSPRGGLRRHLPAALAGVAGVVALVNFLVMSWGAPAPVAALLRTQPGSAALPLAPEQATALFAPGRAIYHEYPPQAGNWPVGTVGQAISRDCISAGSCQVAVLSCLPDFSQASFAYFSARQELEDRLRFLAVDPGPNFYLSLLDADYLVGKTGDTGCVDQAPSGDGDERRRQDNVMAVYEMLAGSPDLNGRFETIQRLENLPDGSGAWVMRRTGPTIDQLDAAQQAVLLQHVLDVTPQSNRARQELSAALDQIGDPVRAIELREEAVAQDPGDVAARLALADLYGQSGRYDQAIEQYQQVLDLEPDQGQTGHDLHLKLADAYAHVGRWEDAAQAYTKAVEIAPDDYETRLRQGLFYVQRGDFADSTAALLEATRLDPQRPEAYLALARAHLLRDDMARAQELFQQARDVAPASPDPLLAWADILLARGDMDGALNLYAEAVDLAPDNVDAYVRWIEALRSAGRDERALALAESLAETFPNSPDALKAVGDVYRSQGRADEALAEYRAVLELVPGQVTARLALAGTLADMGRIDEARAVYSAGLELPGGRAELLTALADLEAAQGDPASAIEHYLATLEINPAYWQAAEHLGRLYLAQDRPSMALETALGMVDLRPDIYQIAMLAGDAYGALGRPDDALVAYRKAVALAPQVAALHSRIGQLQLDARNFSAAQASFDEALRLDPRNVDAYLGRGFLFLALAIQENNDPLAGSQAGPGVATDDTRYFESSDAFRSALLFDPDNLDARIGTGDLNVAYGRLDEAIPYYQEVLTADPSQEAVRQKLFDVYLQQGKTGEVLAFYRRLRDENPDDPAAAIALAEAYMAAGQPDNALLAYDLFLAGHRDDVPALLAQANTLVGLGRTEEALGAYDRLSRLVPDDPDPLIDRAGLLTDLGRLDEAERAYEAAVRAVEATETGPSGSLYQAYTGLARLQLIQGKTDQAVETANTIAQARPDSAEVQILLGDIDRLAGNRVDALASYRQAVRLSPDSPLAHSRVGDILLEVGQLEDAKAAYQAGLDIDPQHAGSLIGLARILNQEASVEANTAQPLEPEEREDRLQRARQLLERVLASDPESLAAQQTLGDVLLNLGLGREAIEHFQSVLLREPDNASAIQSLAQALLAAGDVEQAIASYQTAAADAETPATRNRWLLTLAATYRSLGRSDEAEQTYQSILQADPGQATARIALGDLYIATERYEDAVAQYRAQYQVDPTDVDVAFRLGKAYLLVEDLDQAAAIVQDILARNPSSYQAHLLAARVAQAQGNEPAALVAFRQAASLAPTNSVVQTQVGDGYLAAGRLDDAMEAYNAAASLERRNADALVGLGRVYLRQGALPSAESALRRALNLTPDYLPALATLGRTLLAAGRPADAIPYLEAAVAQRADHPTAVPDLANAYLAAGRIDDGLAIYQANLDTGDEQSQLVIAQALLDAGQTDRAIAAYESFAAGHPADPQALTALARAYRQAGRAEDALATFQQAIDSDSTFVDAHIQLGDLLLNRGQLEEATHAYEAAVALLKRAPERVQQPDGDATTQGGVEPWRAWTGLMRAYALQGRLEDALAAGQEIQALRPDVLAVQLQIGDAYRDLERYDEALAAYQGAAGLAQASPVPHTRQGDLYLRLDQPEQAEVAYEEALSLDSTNADALEGLGRVYAEYGAGSSAIDFFKAEARFQRAIELAPSASAYVALGDLYVAYGRPEDAIEQYRAALELEPDHATARGQLARALLAAGEPEAALDQQLQRLQDSPNDAGVLLDLAVTYRALGRYDDAENAYRQSIAARPGDLALPIALGDLYMEQGLPEQAIPMYQAVVEATEQASSERDLLISGQAQDQLGKAYARIGQLDQALATAQALVESQPELDRGYLLLGDLYQAQGDLQAAEAAYLAGAAQIPDSAALQLRLANLYLQQDRPAEAQDLLEALIETHPREVDAYVGLARAHMAQAGDLKALRFEWANTALQTALRIDPGSVAARTALGDLMAANDRLQQAADAYETVLSSRVSGGDDTVLRLKLAAVRAAMGQWDLALQEYQRAAVANPTDVGIQMSLGNAYWDAGRTGRALEQYRKINRLAPGFAYAYIKQGDLLTVLGRSGEALDAYRAAVEAAPHNADTHFTLASAYRAQGMVDDAIAALEAGLAIDPNRESARQALETLRAGDGS